MHYYDQRHVKRDTNRLTGLNPLIDKLQYIADGLFKYFENIENKPCNLHIFWYWHEETC